MRSERAGGSANVQRVTYIADIIHCCIQIVDDSVDFKTKVNEILTNSGYSESRPAKMDIDDLLKCVPLTW